MGEEYAPIPGFNLQEAEALTQEGESLYIDSGAAGKYVETIKPQDDELSMMVNWATLLLDSGTIQRANLWINMELSGAPIIDNYLVMTYMQFRDPEKTGRYQSFTCATYHWRHRPAVAKWFEVKNFYGSEKFS